MAFLHAQILWYLRYIVPARLQRRIDPLPGGEGGGRGGGGVARTHSPRRLSHAHGDGINTQNSLFACMRFPSTPLPPITFFSPSPPPYLPSFFA